MPTLIVALSSQALAGDKHRFVLSGRGLDAPGDSGSASLAQLPRAAQIVVVVPAGRLSWHCTTVPKVNAARMRSALGGMLEERLLDEPSALHFALAPGAIGGEAAWVATCDKAWLQAALQNFENAGRQVTRVVPEYEPLAGDGTPRVYVTEDRGDAWLVRCAGDGVQALPVCGEWSRASWDVAFGGTGADAGDPVFSEPAVAALARKLFGDRTQLRDKSAALMAAARSGWNLAQFDFALTGSSRWAKRFAQAWAHGTGTAWRPARLGLAALVAANLFGLNAWAWKERAVLDAKTGEVRHLLTKTFPKVQLVVDARLQMQREVDTLRQATGTVSHRDLEPMLVALSGTAASGPPVALDYVAHELSLKGMQPLPEGANALAQTLAAAGYSARIDGDTWVVRAGSLAAADAGTAP